MTWLSILPQHWDWVEKLIATTFVSLSLQLAQGTFANVNAVGTRPYCAFTFHRRHSNRDCVVYVAIFDLLDWRKSQRTTSSPYRSRQPCQSDDGSRNSR